MNLILRIAKKGKKKTPFYNLNIIQKKGKGNTFVYDKIGNYTRQKESRKVELNWNKIIFWLKKGINIDKKILNIIFLIHTNEKKNVNSQFVKKGDYIAINYLIIQQNKLKENDFIGLCMKIKKKSIIKLKNKIQKEKVNFNIFANSPIILKIKKIRNLIKEKTHFSKF